MVLYRINDVMNSVSKLLSILSPLIIGLFLALMMRPPIRFIEHMLSKIPPGGRPSRRRLTVVPRAVAGDHVRGAVHAGESGFW